MATVPHAPSWLDAPRLQEGRGMSEMGQCVEVAEAIARAVSEIVNDLRGSFLQEFSGNASITCGVCERGVTGGPIGLSSVDSLFSQW